MSKHTPGKWEINDLEDGSAEIVVWDYDSEGDVEGSTIVVPVLYYDDEKSIADANVLVAAKDMLEALESVVKMAIAGDEYSYADWGKDYVEDERVTNAKTIIARAKGESQ